MSEPDRAALLATPTSPEEGESMTTKTFDPGVLDADRAFANAQTYDGVKIVGFGEEMDALILGWHDEDAAKRVYGEWCKWYAGEMTAEEIDGLDIERRKVWFSEHVPDSCLLWEWSTLDAADRALMIEDGEEPPESCHCDEWQWWASIHAPEATGADLVEVMTVRVP